MPGNLKHCRSIPFLQENTLTKINVKFKLSSLQLLGKVKNVKGSIKRQNFCYFLCSYTKNLGKLGPSLKKPWSVDQRKVQPSPQFR